MHFTSEKRLHDGVLERGFNLGEIPGILWLLRNRRRRWSVWVGGREMMGGWRGLIAR
jgi:hypothetical protein